MSELSHAQAIAAMKYYARMALSAEGRSPYDSFHKHLETAAKWATVAIALTTPKPQDTPHDL